MNNKTIKKSQWVTKVIKEETKSPYNPMNLWETAKAMIKGKFIAVSTYIKKTQTYQVNDLIMHLKLLEKQEHTKPKTSR
jgi:hypothetical protein